VRALGWGLGWLLYGLAVPRRRVVQINLALCFPGWTAARRQALVPKVFIHFAQAWLDRSWLWHGRPEVTRQRLGLTGALAELQGSAPTVIFAPHFVGLDAGWTALTQQLPRVPSPPSTPTRPTRWWTPGSMPGAAASARAACSDGRMA
jgi:KDO2-lipid IV(A) lauroyltransferase